MRCLSLVVATCGLGACATPKAKQVVAQAAPKPATACNTASPRIIVDGVVQPPSCDRSKADTTQQCRTDGPLYVVDGVKVCRRP